jgi:hypothetical protein
VNNKGEINLDFKKFTDASYNNADSIRDGYPEFEAALETRFNKLVGEGTKLFQTNTEVLYELYLSKLPEESRQHYNCNTCKTFINRYGGLVTINDNGTINSVMWDEALVPEFFVRAVTAMKYAVLTSQVNGVFIPDQKVLGTPKTGEWSHLSIQLPREMVNKSIIRTSGQMMAEKLEDFKLLIAAIQEFSIDTVNQAIALLESETMYRSDRVLAPAKWFKRVIENYNRIQGAGGRRSMLWLEVATAPTGFTHIRSSMIGTLLSDIQEGMSAALVSARFAEKMNPSNYQRSQTPPSSNALYEAEKLVEKLGISQSLQRRYATYDDVPSFLWEDTGVAPVTKEESKGVFGHLKPKSESTNGMDIPPKLMTWEKFQQTVLPSAEQIEVKVQNPNRFMALVTAADPLAPSILQWDDNSFT